jgi:peptide-methionine (S)-S-oxide reductase
VNRLLRLYDLLMTRVLDRLRDPLLLALRLFIGWQFFVTGKGKLENIDHVVVFFTQLGLPMPGLTAHFVALVELLGGALLFVGLATRLTALVLTVNMTAAYVTADLAAVKHFFSNPDEFVQATPFPYFLISLIILAFGAGVFSLDWIVRKVVTAKAGAGVVAASALALLTFQAFGATPASAQTAKATFAMGCFWCGESDMEKVSGVLTVVSGYTGGSVKNPSYEEVSGGGTGHRESVEVTYDPSKVTYEHLLEVFWHNVDPLDNDGQFCDKGPQYRAAIFYHDAAQKQAAEASKAALMKRFPHMVTDILATPVFYPAEDYHQDYYKKNPVRYHFYRFNCGRDQRLKEVWGAEANSH